MWAKGTSASSSPVKRYQCTSIGSLSSSLLPRIKRATHSMLQLKTKAEAALPASEIGPDCDVLLRVALGLIERRRAERAHIIPSSC
eukprot:COSAG01_NODE_9791_length_2343_cov_1.417558_1_plen_86_part_00